MYYYWLNDAGVYFLDIYAKNEKENLSGADKKLMKDMLNELTGGRHA